MNIKVKIKSAKGIHNALEDYGKRISMAALESVMEDAADYATDRYATAKYAGVDPVDWKDGVEVYVEETGPLSRQVIAEGDIVGFIEYGTGVRATAQAKGAKHKQRWWFNADGRKIVANEYAEQAHPYTRKSVFVTDEEGRYREPLKKPETVNREGVYFTRGNPPNYIMRDTQQYILDHIQEAVEAQKK